MFSTRIQSVFFSFLKKLLVFKPFLFLLNWSFCGQIGSKMLLVFFLKEKAKLKDRGPKWKKKMVGNFKDGIKCSLWSSYFQISYIFVPLVFLKLHFVSKFYFSYFSVPDLRNERVRSVNLWLKSLSWHKSCP